MAQRAYNYVAMAKKNKTTYLHVRCTKEWKELVDAAAAKTTEGVSVMVRQAIDRYLDAEYPGWDDAAFSRGVEAAVKERIRPSKADKK